MCGTASSQKCHVDLLQFVMLSIYHLFSRISIHLQRYFIKIRAAVHYFVQQTPLQDVLPLWNLFLTSVRVSGTIQAWTGTANGWYSFSFLPRVANLDFSALSVYVTVGCSHSPPYYLKQQIAVIDSSIPFRICPRHPRKTKTPFLCGKSFSRPAAYRIHRVLTSPWFSPSCPKAEVSLFCDGS